MRKSTSHTSQHHLASGRGNPTPPVIQDDEADLAMDGPNDMQDYTEPSTNLPPPPENVYPDRDSLVAAVQAHGRQHGYNVSIKTSSGPNEGKPGRAGKVWLRCDRGGTYRPRNGLTEETRKRKRNTRLLGCPFVILGIGTPGGWTVNVQDGRHNHGPDMGPPRALPQRKIKKGQIEAVPYDWPHDASFSKLTTALVLIDMQRDFCEPGGYLEYQGCDISPTRALIPKLQHLLQAFRDAKFPVYHTREGHRPDLSTLSSREEHRSYNNVIKLGIGSEGPLGRLLIRGEPGHDIVRELYPLPNEPVIDKPGRGAFAHTDFDLLLRIKGIKNLVIAGVTTDVCVSSTMREANDRAYDCFLVEDGAAASEPDLHHSTCESVKMEGGIFGVTGKLDTVVDALEALKIGNSKSGTKSNPINLQNMPNTPRTSGLAAGPSMTAPSSAGFDLSMSSMTGNALNSQFVFHTPTANGGLG